MHTFENIISAIDRRHQTALVKELPMKLSFQVNINNTCVACKSGKHSLSIPRNFRSLTRGQMMVILKEHGHCMNCVKPGHLLSNVPAAKAAGMQEA